LSLKNRLPFSLTDDRLEERNAPIIAAIGFRPTSFLNEWRQLFAAWGRAFSRNKDWLGFV
jgi:hypothetical protein